MQCLLRRLSVPAGWMLAALCIGSAPAMAGIVAYTDRAAFIAALGSGVSGDDFEAYAPGSVGNNTTLGAFVYGFAGTVQPAVVSGGFGGQALGGPFDVFVGGDAVTLTVGGTTPLRAFGLDFLYAPSFDTIAADIYRLQIGDGSSTGASVGNGTLDAAGGAFFLGLVADAGSEFNLIGMRSVVPVDANGDPQLVPAYQVDNLVYALAGATPVSEPGSLALVLAACAGLLLRGRRQH